MLKKWRYIFIAIIILIVAGVVLWWLLGAFSKSGSTSEVVALPFSISADEKLFALGSNFNALFSYDPNTKKIERLVETSNPNASINAPQKLAGNFLGFEVNSQGNATGSGSADFYTLNLDTGILVDEAAISSHFDGIDFIAQGEFVYTQPVNPSAPFNEYSDEVFLFRNGTTTEIGHISNPGLYGSDMSHSSDGKYLFFANNIYDMTAGVWRPVPAGCAGNQSAWLNNDVLVLKTVRDDSGVGPLCYYDLSTGAEKTIGAAQWFSVAENDIFYEPVFTTTNLSQIRIYDFAKKTDKTLISNAKLSMREYDPNNWGWVLYQPVVNDRQCFTVDCLGGTASGSLMLFNFGTGSSSSIMVGTSTDFVSWL